MTVDSAIADFTLRHPVRRRKLVAVSGGRDSTALLHALHATGHRNLVVCHLNHRLRGRASAGDAAFVRRLANRLGFPCEVVAVNVTREAQRAGESLETAGRRARHRFLAECARRHRCRLVLMAHHADDQAETVLFNLLRGAAGLRGMEPETELRVPDYRTPLRLLRPLLAVTRADIDAWIAARGLTFREDATNAEPAASRNQLRLTLLPFLSEALGRDVRPALRRAAEISRAEQEWLDELAAPAAAADTLDARALRAESPALQRRVLWLWLRRQALRGIGFDEVEAVRAMLDLARGPARVNLPDNRFVRRTDGRLRVEPARRRRVSREIP
jgi:tRNA(Ile)-lysidine synthase